MARLVVIIFAALIIGSIVLSGNNEAAASGTGIYALHVHITEPATQQAVVTDKQNGSLAFHGTAQATYWPAESVAVELVVTIDTDWAADISPNSMVITYSGLYLFNLTVIVPEATHADAVGHIKVTATGTGGGLTTTGEANATVTVAPYFNFSIVSNGPNREILPKEYTSFTFKVQNHGNAIDYYELKIANARELEDAGWSVEFSKSMIAGVPPEGTLNVSIIVMSPQGWNWDIWIDLNTPIILKADSLAAIDNNTTETQTLPVHVNVKGYNNPLLELLTTTVVLTAVGVTIFAIIRWRRKKGKQTHAKEES